MAELVERLVALKMKARAPDGGANQLRGLALLFEKHVVTQQCEDFLLPDVCAVGGESNIQGVATSRYMQAF